MAANKLKSFSIAFLLAAVVSPLAGCGGGIDPVAANAVAGCETATADQLVAGATMLPGRACGNCHKAGGQAAEHIFTVAGTVYSNPMGSCNSGGVANATVEILKMDGSVQMTLTTNAVGNFYSHDPVMFPLKARVKATGKTTLEMAGAQSSGNCASCHAKPGLSGAPGRIYIQ